MLKKIALTTALFAVLGSAHAYQAEIGGTIRVLDPDQGSTSAGFALDGTYYFNPVQVKNSPLNEAAFLNRASNVNAHVGYDDYDYYDETYVGAGLEYYVPNTDFYAGAKLGYSRSEENVTGGKQKYDYTSYGVEVGYLPAPGLLIAAGLTGWDDDNDDGVDPTLRAKYVTQIGKNDINLEAYAGFGDLDEFSLAADYYINKTLSLGIDYYNQDYVGGGSYDEFGVNAKKFINQQVSVEGRIGFGDDNDNFGVRAAYRF